MSVLTPFRNRVVPGRIPPMISKPTKPVVVAPTDGDKFNLRMPTGLREQIAREAKRAGHSMNTEIVTRLVASLQGEEGSRTDKTAKAVCEELGPKLDRILALLEKK